MSTSVIAPPTKTSSMWRELRRELVGLNPELASRHVLQRLGVQDAPIPIETVLARLGVELVRMDTAEAGGSSGAVTLMEDVPNICVNASEAPVRQRFTMAHELGHLLMHPLGREDVLFRDTSFAGSPIEAQANQFAAGMLMPLWLVEQIASRPGMTGDTLCRIFSVSPAAMKIRLDLLRGVPVRWGG